MGTPPPRDCANAGRALVTAMDAAAITATERRTILWKENLLEGKGEVIIPIVLFFLLQTGPNLIAFAFNHR
jgi:hypothetical protein